MANLSHGGIRQLEVEHHTTVREICVVHGGGYLPSTPTTNRSGLTS